MAAGWHGLILVAYGFEGEAGVEGLRHLPGRGQIERAMRFIGFRGCAPASTGYAAPPIAAMKSRRRTLDSSPWLRGTLSRSGSHWNGGGAPCSLRCVSQVALGIGHQTPGKLGFRFCAAKPL